MAGLLQQERLVPTWKVASTATDLLCISFFLLGTVKTSRDLGRSPSWASLGMRSATDDL